MIDLLLFLVTVGQFLALSRTAGARSLFREVPPSRYALELQPADEGTTKTPHAFWQEDNGSSPSTE